MGYSHIPQKYAKPINAFYEGVFNSRLNLHRPCLYATEIVSEKGKIIKRYKHKDVKTPLECLVLLNEKGLVKFKAVSRLKIYWPRLVRKPTCKQPRKCKRPRQNCSSYSTNQNSNSRPKVNSHQEKNVHEKIMRAGGASGGLAGAWMEENQKTKTGPLKLTLLTRSSRTAEVTRSSQLQAHTWIGKYCIGL